MKPKYFNNTLVAALLTAGPPATSQHCLQVARPDIRHVGLSRDRRGSTAVCMYSASRQLTNRRTRQSQSSAEEAPERMVDNHGAEFFLNPLQSHSWSRNVPSSDLARRKKKYIVTDSRYWTVSSAS